MKKSFVKITKSTSTTTPKLNNPLLNKYIIKYVFKQKDKISIKTNTIYFFNDDAFSIVHTPQAFQHILHKH